MCKYGVELFEFDLPLFTTPYVDLMIANTPEAKWTLQMVKNANKKEIEKVSDRISTRVPARESWLHGDKYGSSYRHTKPTALYRTLLEEDRSHMFSVRGDF